MPSNINLPGAPQEKKLFGLSAGQIAAMSPEVLFRYFKDKYTHEDIAAMSEGDAELLMSVFDEGDRDKRPFAPVINEQHPELSDVRRAQIKNIDKQNFSIDALVQDGFEVDFGKSNEFLIKKQGETDWYKVEPEGLGDGSYGDQAIEAGQDALDIGVDAAQIIGETYAAGTGGILGAMTPIPGGALMGAAGGGALAAAAADTIRQGMAMASDVPYEYDPESLKTELIWGAAPAPFVGSGAKTTSKLARGLAKKSGKSLEAMANAQRGYPKRLWDVTAPVRDRAATALSGVPGETWKHIRIPGKFALAKATGAQPINTTIRFLDGVRDAHSAKFNKFVYGVGGAGYNTEQLVKASDKLIDVSAARKPIEDLAEESLDLLALKGGESPVNWAAALEANSLLSKYFPQNSHGKLVDEVPALVAWRLKQTLANLGEVSKNKPYGSGVSETKSVAKRTSIGNVKKAGKKLGEDLNRTLGPEYQKLNKEYSDLKKSEKIVGKVLNNDDPLKAIRDLASPTKEFARSKVGELDKQIGTNLLEVASDMQAAKHVGQPGIMSKSSDAVTATARTLAGVGLGAGIGSTIGQGVGYWGLSNLSPGEGGGMFGGLIGAGLGTVAFGPRSLRNLYGLAGGIEKLPQRGPLLSIPHTMTRIPTTAVDERGNP